MMMMMIMISQEKRGINKITFKDRTYLTAFSFISYSIVGFVIGNVQLGLTELLL